MCTRAFAGLPVQGSSKVASGDGDEDGGIDFGLCRGEWVNMLTSSTAAGTEGQPQSGPSSQQKPPSKAKGKSSVSFS